MVLSSEERETVINFNSVDKTASIYTSQPAVWRRLERIKGFNLLEENRIKGEVVSKDFEFPKSFIKFTKRGFRIGSPKIVSAKFREQAKERLQGRRISGKPIVNQDSKTPESA